jgi:hypothetical protein
MNYAFRVFGAIYNYRVVDQVPSEEARKFIYSAAPAGSDGKSGAVRIPARYSPRPENERLSNPCRVRYAGEDFYLFHGRDPLTLQPDWLGEIFEWLSSSHEKSISRRDSIGRIPDSEMIFDRAGLPAWKPQAALQMAWLEHISRNGTSSEALPRAPSPLASGEHLMICSHDVDFHFTNRTTALQRLIKNLGISWLVYASPTYFFSNCGMLLKLLAGKRVGDYLLPLCELLEEHGCRSTFFVVSTRSHRRDPNYEIGDLALPIKEAFMARTEASSRIIRWRLKRKHCSRLQGRRLWEAGNIGFASMVRKHSSRPSTTQGCISILRWDFRIGLASAMALASLFLLTISSEKDRTTFWKFP